MDYAADPNGNLALPREEPKLQIGEFLLDNFSKVLGIARLLLFPL
jgi:hypothetical protein